MEAEVQIKGLAELLRDLDTLPVRVEKNCIRAALRKGVEEFAREMGRRVPVGQDRKNWRGLPHRGGTLLRSMKIRASFKKNLHPTVKLSIGSREAFYAHILERGAKPHSITPRNAKTLAFGGHFAKQVNHPGIAPRYFVRDTFYQAQGAALSAFIAYLNQRLPRELKKQSAT